MVWHKSKDLALCHHGEFSNTLSEATTKPPYELSARLLSLPTTNTHHRRQNSHVRASLARARQTCCEFAHFNIERHGISSQYFLS